MATVWSRQVIRALGPGMGVGRRGGEGRGGGGREVGGVGKEGMDERVDR